MTDDAPNPRLLRTHALPVSMRDLPWPLGVLIPVAIYPGLVLCAIVPALRPVFMTMQQKEGGIEFLAFGALVVGVLFGVGMLVFYRRRLPQGCGWVAWWYALITLGMLVLAGEEISWGQHLGLWGHETAEGLLGDLNDQQETNLHNISNAFDQLPTYAVMVATLIGCVLNPLYLRLRRETLSYDNPGFWFWPTRVCLMAALGVLLITWPKRVVEWGTGEKVSDLWRHSEIHEFYIALLMTIYILSACRRLGTLPAQPNT